jgi:TonB-linked SusC/RagA family outer membrane protein
MNSQELYDYTASMQGAKPSWFTPSLTDNNTDWLDLSTQNALSQNYTLSYTRGTEKVRTYIMADYYNEEGTVKGFEYTRYSLRANNDYIVNKRLTVKTKFSGSYYHNFSQAYSMGGAMLYLPWDNPYDANGVPRRVTSTTSDWYSRYQSNPVYDLPFGWSRGKALGVSGNVGFDFKFTDWLIFESTNNISYRYTLDETYTDPKAIGAEEYNGALKADNNFYTTRFTTQLLRFIKTFNEKHDVTAFLGYEYSDYSDHTNSAEKRGIPANGEVFNTAATPYAIDGNVNEWALQSVFFNANYTFDDRYMAQFSLRTDGSSRFGSDNRYGTFYTVGAGWAIHKESFFKNLSAVGDYVNELKLRASYGSIGNLPNSNYGYLTTYSLNRSYNGVPAATPSRLGNPGLTWEECYETNIAVDMRLLDRFGLSVEWYNKNTSRLLYDVPMSSVSGYSSQWQNVGAIRNQGVEIVFSPDIIRTPDLLWTADFNIGINRGTAVKLIETAAEGNRQIMGGDMSAQTVRKEGTALDTWYVREWAGVDMYSGEPMWYKYNEDGSRELTSNWNDATRVEAGTQNPKFSGGLATSVTWKGITLSATMNFVYGNKIFNGARQFYDNDGAYPTFNSMKLKDGWVRWEKPGDIATHPKPVYGGNASSQNPSTRYLEDGSFFKLGSLSLSYALPQKWLQKINVKGLDLTLSGEKLFTLTNYSGFDPEVAGSAGSLGEGMQYPAPRRFSVGLNLTF